MTERGEELSGPIAPVVDEGGGAGAASSTSYVSLSIDIQSPQDGATIACPPGGVPISVNGTALCLVGGEENIGFIEKIEVRFGSGATFVRATPTGPNGDWSSWSFTGTARVIGPLNIAAIATSQPYGPSRVRTTAVDDVSVSMVDTTPPQLTIDPLPNGGRVFGTDRLFTVGLTGTATDTQTGVKSVELSVDGGGVIQANQLNDQGGGRWGWSASLQVPLGRHTIAVRCKDRADNASTQSVTVEAVDTTPPGTTITVPDTDGFTKLGTEEGTTVTVSGTATDIQSGVSEVKWTLDNAPENFNDPQYRVATRQAPDWSSWAADVPVPLGEHTINVRAKDNAGNVMPSPATRTVRVARTYTPQDQEDNVSSLAYLRDLLEFARDRITVTSTGQTRSLELEDLEQEFFQPFGDLTSKEQVRQLRICIEVLRKCLDPRPTDAVASWSFDEGSGTTAADSSGNGNNGTLQVPTWTAGRVGKALSFDGIDDYVQIGAAANLVMTKAVSISAWIYPKGTGTSGVGGIIVNKEGEYQVARFPDGTIRWAFANSNPGWTWVSTGYVAPVNQWTHIAVVYDNGTVETYANGELVHTYEGLARSAMPMQRATISGSLVGRGHRSIFRGSSTR